MNKAFSFIFLSFFIIITSQVFSEDVKSIETSANVKELIDFHDVIYRVWHDAWPTQNIKLLKELWPEIESGAIKVEKAQLPGILREKKVKWETGIKELKKLVADYKAAADKNDSSALMNSAEKLHAQFEKLVRTIRPSMKELEDYHVTLYNIYHYYMPEYNYDKIKTAVDELNLKMETLMKAAVPKRLEKKTDKFVSARNDLKASLQELTKEIAVGNNKEKITTAIEKMHTKYQNLNCVFD